MPQTAITDRSAPSDRPTPPAPGAGPALPLEPAALARVCRGVLRERLSRTRGTFPPPVPDDLPLAARAGASAGPSGPGVGSERHGGSERHAGSDPDSEGGRHGAGAADSDAGTRAGVGPEGAAGLALDSLEMLEIVADLDRRFALSRTGIEDHLLLSPTLGDWGRLIAEHLARSGSDLPLTFFTSGSQGAPRPVAHTAHALLAETDALLEALWRSGAAEPPARVVTMVPCHHLFGFVFGALVPARAGWPVVDAAGRAPGAVLAGARPGDLVVATPHLISLALRAGGAPPRGVSVVVSGAAAPAELWQRTAMAGLSLMEVYGATETGGLGWRRDGSARFALLPHLWRDGAALRGPDGTALPLPDRLSWHGARTFAVHGRLDRQVQVGGVNVSPDAVARHLAAQDAVVEAAVRLDPGTGRLKAFVVPADGTQATGGMPPELEARLRAACADLPAPARPQRYTAGPALPRAPSGKLADW